MFDQVPTAKETAVFPRSRLAMESLITRPPLGVLRVSVVNLFLRYWRSMYSSVSTAKSSSCHVCGSGATTDCGSCVIG